MAMLLFLAAGASSKIDALDAVGEPAVTLRRMNSAVPLAALNSDHATR